MILVAEDSFHYDWHLLTIPFVVVTCQWDHILHNYVICHSWVFYQKFFTVNPYFGVRICAAEIIICQWQFKNIHFKQNLSIFGQVLALNGWILMKYCLLEDKFLPLNRFFKILVNQKAQWVLLIGQGCVGTVIF